MSNDLPLVRAAAIGVACSVAFAAGIAFDTFLWGEDRRISRAVMQANDFGRMLDSFGYSVGQTAQYEDLKRVTTLEDVEQLKQKYRSAALENLKRYERQVSELPDERRRALLVLHQEMTAELKKRLDASP